MKKYLSILFILLSLFAKAQTTDVPASTRPTLGVLYSGGTAYTGTSDFTTNVGTSLSVSGGKITITTTTQNSFSSYAAVTKYGNSLLEDNTIFLRFKIDSAKAATSKGLSVSYVSNNSHVSISYYFYCDLTLGGTGRMYLTTNYPSQTTLDSTFAPIMYSTGDSLEYVVTRTYGNLFTATARNVSTSAPPISFTFAYSSVFSNPTGVYNNSYYAIGDLGGK